MRPVLLRTLFMALALVVGCGVPLADSIERDLRHGGSIPDALARIQREEPGARAEAYRRVALAVIEASATSEQALSRERAFATTSALGSFAEPLLERLAASDDSDVASRARVMLARRGDRSARRELERDLASDDDARVARALSVVGTDVDTTRLLAFLESTSSDTRREAANALVGRDPESGSERLFEAARRDPSPRVRAAACRASVRDAATAERVAAFVESETDTTVYGACVAAIAARRSADYLVAKLEALPASLDERSFEVVRAGFASREDQVRVALVALLPAWLASERPSIRAALVNVLPADVLGEPSLGFPERLAAERVVVVRVAIASRLVRLDSTRAAATTTLEELASLDTIDGVEAASLLRAQGRAGGTSALRSRLGATDPLLRAAALRGLRGDSDAGARAAFLVDADESVRLAAAASLF